MVFHITKDPQRGVYYIEILLKSDCVLNCLVASLYHNEFAGRSSMTNISQKQPHTMSSNTQFETGCNTTEEVRKKSVEVAEHM